MPVVTKHHDTLVRDMLHQLDTGSFDMTPKEAEFMESFLRQTKAGWSLKPKQIQVLVWMVEKYLSVGLAAELKGQQRLL